MTKKNFSTYFPLLKKVFKVTFFTFFSLITIFSIIIGYFVYTLEPNAYIPKIEKAITENSDFKAKIKTDASWSFFPKLSINLKSPDIQLNSKKENIDLKANDIKLKFSFLDLVYFSLNFHDIEITNAKFKLNNQNIKFDKLLIDSFSLPFDLMSKVSFRYLSLKNASIVEPNKLNIQNFNTEVKFLESNENKINYELNIDWDKIKLQSYSKLYNIFNSHPDGYGEIEIQKFDSEQIKKSLFLKDFVKIPDINLFFKFNLNYPFFEITKFNIKTKPDGNINGKAKFNIEKQDEAFIKLNLENIDLSLLEQPKSSNNDTGLEDTNKAKKRNDRLPPVNAKSVKTTNKSNSSFPLQKLDGEIKGYNIYKETFKINDLYAKFTTKNDNIKLKPFYIFVAKDKYDLEANFNTKSKKLELKGNTKDSDINNLMKYISSKQVITAKTNINIDLNSTGTSGQSLIKNLNGKNTLSMQDGTIYGLSLEILLKEAMQSIDDLINSGESLPKLLLKLGKNTADASKAFGKDKVTNFHQLNGNLIIKNGIAFNDDFILEHDNYIAKGKGKINLITEQIDYKIFASIKSKKSDSKVTETIKFMQETPILIRVSGSLHSPQVLPDLGEYLQVAIKNLLKDAILDAILPIPTDIIPGGENTPNPDSAPTDNLKKLIPFKKLLPIGF